MTDQELMQMALDALNSKYIVNCGAWQVQRDQAIESLRAALAQPEPKPVAWMERERAVGYREGHQAALKQREWQGLTEADCEEVERWVEFKEEGSGRIPTLKLIRYIEAKLKEKNT